MNDDRYQFQPWYVKLYRQARHVPPGYIKAVWCIIRWVMRGMPLTRPTYWMEIKLIWLLATAMIDIRINHVHTHEEVMGRVKDGR